MGKAWCLRFLPSLYLKCENTDLSVSHGFEELLVVVGGAACDSGDMLSLMQFRAGGEVIFYNFTFPIFPQVLAWKLGVDDSSAAARTQRNLLPALS